MIMRKFCLVFALFLLGNFVQAQSLVEVPKPKLVVGLVVDQMRWDYLYRYQDLYSDNGFKRILKDGFSCENTMIPYLPTYTAPGHTCVYTGSVPAIHGIVGNDWYDASIQGNMYCAGDSTINTIGSSSTQGKMSPRNMLTTTIGDELRLSTNFRNKVIGVALKDRGAILPAGHAANAAYWYDDTAGGWISSSYYFNQLPAWVTEYNQQKYVDKAMAKDWNTLLPIDKYTNSSADNKVYEGTLPEEKQPVFPHRLSKISKAKYSAFKYTPAAASYTFDMAKAIVKNEQMGRGEFTDMLAVSISSTDYMGHTFGPNSIEAEDTYLRLDLDIADFLNYLDVTVGKGNYLFFLTADHAAAHVPGFLKENNIPGENISSSGLRKDLIAGLKEVTGIDNALIKIQNNQVYLDMKAIRNAGKKVSDTEEKIIDMLLENPMIEFAYPTRQIATQSIPEPIKKMLINGYNPKRSGQIGYVLKPGYISMGSTGTTHGAWNPYDAHIPLVWYGTGIKAGKTNRETYMTDIAPTIAALLQIQMPNGAVGKVIEEVKSTQP